MELSPFFRMVAYPEMETCSRTISELFCSFMRTGKPSAPGLVWPEYDLAQRATMIFDRRFSVVSDPLKTERKALDRAAGHRKVVNSFLDKQYKFPSD